MTDRTIRNGSVELATRDHGGDGPDLLLLPGAERTLLDFRALAPQLAESFHVVSMDLRNHGGSGTGPWTTDNVAGDIEAVIRELGLTTPAVVGHSLGGMVAAAHAVRYPGSSSAAVNLDGIGLGRFDQYVGISPTSLRLKRFMLDGLTRLQQRTESFPIGKLEETHARRLAEIRQWGHDDAGAEEVWQRTVAPAGEGRMAIRPNGPQMREVFVALDQLDMFAEYRRVTCPLLILNCNDPWNDELPGWVRSLIVALRRGIARDYAALVADRPNVTVHPIDARHDRMLFDNTDELAAIVTDFLIRVPERA